MMVLFVAGFGPVSPDPAASRRFYADALGLDLEADGDYLHTERLGGVKHFAVWPLGQAAEACFGQPTWPPGLHEPHAWVEFDVDDVGAAAAELTGAGYELLHPARTEPWGQTLARLLSPEGVLVGVAHTPWLREQT